MTILAAFAAIQARLRETLAALAPAEVRTPYHRRLSPLGWHLGHTVTVEAYWVREVVGGAPLPADVKRFYFPETSPKAARARRLPDQTELLDFASTWQAQTLRALTDALQGGLVHALLQNDYLAHFLVQHHAQHLETMQQILRQRLLARARALPADRAVRLEPSTPRPPETRFADGVVHVGCAGRAPHAFDNELPRHTRALAAFRIARRCVSNAEYLGFVQARGYDDASYWSQAGDDWRRRLRVRSPTAWRGVGGAWVEVGADGARALDAQAPVNGLSYYEAEAFARYAGARLPGEAEWEHAAAQDALDDAYAVWQWCRDSLKPYPGFRAFPYDGYSMPWFDGRHHVLRGGSPHTHPCLKRPSFRNFYTADTRHVFAGVRLAADDA